MPRATKKVRAVLNKKGFIEDDRGDHIYYYWYQNGLKTEINTKVSHGSHKDISDGLLRLMQKQLRLPRKEFEMYLNCTYSKEDYENYLIQNGFVEDRKNKVGIN